MTPEQRKELEAWIEVAPKLDADTLGGSIRAVLARVDALEAEKRWTLDPEAVVGDAQAALTGVFENQTRAVSKGSAAYSELFLRAALADAVAVAIRAALTPEPQTAAGGEEP